MTTDLIGFLCALLVALLVVAWLTYCMFCRERHKPEFYQYDISDIRHKNYQLAQEQEAKENSEKSKKEIAAGVFILPSRRKHKDESYEKRPDYPESPAAVMQPEANQFIEMFNESISDTDTNYKDGIFEIESNAQFQSDV